MRIFWPERLFGTATHISDAARKRLSSIDLRATLSEMNTLTGSVIVGIMFILESASWGADPAQMVVHENGIEFVAWAGVSDAAVKRAQDVIRVMTSNVPGIRDRLAASGFKVEIIGKDQVISYLPDYSDLKGKKTFDGRSFDTGTRGVGGKDKCSIGEENLLCLRNQRYPEEDILVHEFSHSIMANMGTELSNGLCRK